MILNGVKQKTLKKVKMEKKELFNKNIIQVVYQEVFHKNYIIYFKIKRHLNNLIRFIH